MMTDARKLELMIAGARLYLEWSAQEPTLVEGETLLTLDADNPLLLIASAATFAQNSILFPNGRMLEPHEFAQADVEAAEMREISDRLWALYGRLYRAGGLPAWADAPSVTHKFSHI